MPRLRARNQLTEPVGLTPSPPPPTRSRRNQRRSDGSDTIVVADAPSPPAKSEKPGRVTLRMPSSRLREATRAKTSDAASNSPEPTTVTRVARSTRAKRAVVIESGSEDEGDEEEADEDDEDDEEEEDEGGEDMDGDDDDLEMEEEDEVDAEGEDDDMPDAPPQPPPIFKAAQPTPTVKVTPAGPASKLKSVEAKEMQMTAAGVSDDDELSELQSDDEGGEDDAEGEEDDELLGGDDDMGDDDEEDAEGDSDDDGSPDPNKKMTKRQRGRYEMGNDFLQLPMEPQIKKHLTAEEHAMRRAEMARRRKNLSEKRNEEEKMDTINRLLKKQAPKRRGKISAAEIAAGAETPDMAGDEDIPVERADPLFSRWISTKEGIVLGLPSEWKDAPAGAWAGNGGWKVIEEVEG